MQSLSANKFRAHDGKPIIVGTCPRSKKLNGQRHRGIFLDKSGTHSEPPVAPTGNGAVTTNPSERAAKARIFRQTGGSRSSRPELHQSAQPWLCRRSDSRGEPRSCSANGVISSVIYLLTFRRIYTSWLAQIKRRNVILTAIMDAAHLRLARIASLVLSPPTLSYLNRRTQS
jgi:hypothetical protein